MMFFNDFFKKYKLKSKATSNIKNQRVLSSLSLNDIGICLRDDPFKTDIGIVNSYPSKRTHWVCYINENFFVSCGCVCPKNLSEFLTKQYGHCLYSEYEI